MKIGILGFGNMGSSMYEALSKRYSVESIYACDNNRSKLSILDPKYRILEPDKLVREVDYIIISVKPQAIDELLDCIDIDDLNQKTIVSIMAGISISKIKDKLSNRSKKGQLSLEPSKELQMKVVRAMPNLSISVRSGVTGWFTEDRLDQKELENVKNIFSSMGYALRVDTEDDIDKVASISGSGPAYYYYILKAIQNKAEEIGFEKQVAQTLAEKTFLGSAEVFSQNNYDAETWIKMVSSKGGMTEQAIKAFDDAGVGEGIKKGIQRGYERAKKLNR